MMPIKRTINLVRCGYHSDSAPNKPVPIYKVVKTQNTFSPRVGDVLRESEAVALVNNRTTVNIS